MWSRRSRQRAKLWQRWLRLSQIWNRFLFVVQFHGSADGTQHRFALVEFEVVGLAQDQDRAVRTVKAARPAGVGQVEADKLDIMPDGRLSRYGINTIIGFQLRILFAQRVQSGVGKAVRAGHI